MKDAIKILRDADGRWGVYLLSEGEHWELSMCSTEQEAHEEAEAQRLRWMSCETCGGTGEVIKGPPGEPYNEHAELCQACEGTGRDCE